MPKSNLAHLFLAMCICDCVRDTIRKSHVVQPGESLWEIAGKYGVHLERLLCANPQIRDPQMIFPGQLLIVPV